MGEAAKCAPGEEIQRRVQVKWHQVKRKVTEDIAGLKYNTAIAAIMELLNTLREENCNAREVVRDLVLLIAPFAPHFAEECWERLGHHTSVFDAEWPTWDPDLVVEDEVEVVVQVNGKTRSRVRVPRDADESTVVAAAERDDGVQRFTAGKAVRKRVLVPNRLLNLVVE